MTTSRRAFLPSIVAVLTLLSIASTAAADDVLVGPPPPPAANAGSTVHLHVKSKTAAAVERRAPGEKAWVFQCNAPCDQDLPIAGTYRVVGVGRVPLQVGDTFTLDTKDGGPVTVDVQPASVEGTVGGVLLTLPGAGISLLGVAGVAAGASVSARSCNGGDWNICGSSTGGDIIAASAVVLLVGVGLTALGITVLHSSSAHVTKQPFTF